MNHNNQSENQNISAGDSSASSMANNNSNKLAYSKPPTTSSTIANEVLTNIFSDSSKFVFPVEEIKVVDSMPIEDCMRVIDLYSKTHKVNNELTIAGITKLIQSGGTNQSKKGLKVTVGNQEFTLDNLRNVIRSVDKNSTTRKFAKGIRDIVVLVASVNNWPGPLTKEIARDFPNVEIKLEEAYWLLEIHSDNEYCPPYIKELLIRREEKLKLMQKSIPNSNNQKPRQARGKKNNKKK